MVTNTAGACAHYHSPGGGVKIFSPLAVDTLIHSLNMLTTHTSPFIFENAIVAGSR